jgi:hypothetical protein
MGVLTTKKTSEEFVYDVIAHPHVLRWMKHLAETKPQAFMRLTGENRERLKGILGAPTRISNNTVNKEWIWKIERDNVVAWVLSGHMGTILNVFFAGDKESFLSDRNMGVHAVALLSDLMESMQHSRVPFSMGEATGG